MEIADEANAIETLAQARLKKPLKRTVRGTVAGFRTEGFND
jgi:hypothetical protein